MASITAPSLTLRSTKGSPLTNTEVDQNFQNISTQIALGQTAASYTAADVLAKLNTVTGYAAASGLNSDTLTFNSGARSAAATNTANTIVARDASGNFSAGTITAALTGTASIAASLNYTVLISGGGTGATTASGARTALGLAIGTDVQAYTASGNALSGLTSSANATPYFTGSGTASVYTSSSYMRGHMADADAATARSTLGLVIGTNVQAYGAQLSALSGVSTGIAVLTGAGTAAGRTITAGAGISVSNGDGVSGNPTIAANVTSVQGNTGAVIVSVPVSSVQGNTGTVIVSSVAYASSAGGGWPGSLSQFSNNLGNYGGWVPHNTKSHQNPANGGIRRFAGQQGNCGNIQPSQIHNFYLDQGSYWDEYYHHQNCHNCNCVCNC
jgi:hypothetical protein